MSICGDRDEVNTNSRSGDLPFTSDGSLEQRILERQFQVRPVRFVGTGLAIGCEVPPSDFPMEEPVRVSV